MSSFERTEKFSLRRRKNFEYSLRRSRLAKTYAFLALYFQYRDAPVKPRREFFPKPSEGDIANDSPVKTIDNAALRLVGLRRSLAMNLVGLTYRLDRKLILRTTLMNSICLA